ncbi:hypothetical protein EW145_g2641 [Phellinidium pouzarii]|uniref:Uncharacterized protein n=1 Tax=Phellinidium pouzarii TaxID=167371 RepID=A0A4S4LFK1_9AGAM|nr:hypothetical protein EW145_g2641 [Phellinidium pouzarii]
MSFKALLGVASNVAGMPGTDIAVSAAIDLVQVVQNIKIYRSQTQCQNLSDRCTKLLLAFREKCDGLEGSKVMAAADEVTCIIERAHKKASHWAAMSRIKSFIASNVELHRGNHELQLIHERDGAENREILHNILRSVDGLREVLALNASEPNAVQNIMQTIQEELQQQTARPDQQHDLQQGLYEIHRQTQVLPPMIDLTGQVEKVSSSVVYGAYNDVYIGLWLGEEKVALKFARAINHTVKARKRFHKEVEIWRGLQHPHVSRLYGIVYFEGHIYSVSPWMENGSAFDYIISTEEVINRLAILGDVASGMEYLHKRGVVHGDLRAANILIGDDGRACVADFGLSKVIEEVAPDMSSSTYGDSPVRWQARELVKPDEYDGPVSVSPATDIWSYGMLCLEIMTGKKPYHYRPRDAIVIADLVEHRLPERPVDEAVVARGLGDQMWNLILLCWSWEPQDRPTMASVKLAVRSLPSAIPVSPSPILKKVLSESPKPLPNELPSIAEHGYSPRANLSPPSNFKYISSNISSTPPSANILSDASKSAHGHYSPRSTSSGSSSVFDIQLTLASTSRHRPSVSSSPTHDAYSSLKRTPDTGGSLGLTTGQASRGSLREQLFSSAESMRPLHSYSSAQEEMHKRPSSSSMNAMTSEESPSPSGLSLSRPIQFTASDLLDTPPPPKVNVENYDGDHSVVSSSLSSSFDFSRRRGPSLSSGNVATTPYSAGLLYSPLQLSEERIEGEHSGESNSSSVPSSADSPLRHDRTSSFSDSVPSKNTLTDFSDLDCKSNTVRYNKDGTVKAGSLCGLVDRLLKDSAGYARDQEFREIFLTTHRLFAPTRDVLRLLIRRFILADSDQGMPVKDRVGTRFTTLNVLNQLLKGHYAKGIELAVLEDLRAFLQEITSPPVFLKTAQDLINTIDNLLSGNASSRAMSPAHSHAGTRKSARASDITPLGLAFALLFLEGEKYRAITATDCVSYLLHKGGTYKIAEANEVAEARATNNKIVNWVKKSIVKSDRMENRGDTLRFFVNTAAECRKLHNYSSMSALLAGIDSQTVTRLKLTRGCLDKHMRETQKKLSCLLEISHNHRTYRDALPDPKKTLCLPWLAVHLKDLQSVYERHLRQVVIDGESLINFEKFSAVHDSISVILAFQAHIRSNSQGEGDTDRKVGPLLYLEEQLATTHLGQVAEDRLEVRSLELQKQEDRDYEHRVNELAAVGFRTSRGRG